MDEPLFSMFSWDWFSRATLNSFAWSNPVYLYLIAAVPILFFLRWLWRYKKKDTE